MTSRWKPDTRDHSRANYRGVDLWIAEHQGQHVCRCGCGGVIEIRPYMHAPSVGIPKFLPFHYLKSRKFRTAQARRARRRVGRKAHNWRHGRTTRQEVIRKSKPYVEWREAVYRRDNYTCQKCGARSGNGKTVYLNAHHHPIRFSRLWREFVAGTRSKASLFDPALGITLCRPCHRKIHFR